MFIEHGEDNGIEIDWGLQLLVLKAVGRASTTVFFFFQAEDGIRDIGVTGVQTCALPISSSWPWRRAPEASWSACSTRPARHRTGRCWMRSEERRVGKECRSRWSPYH